MLELLDELSIAHIGGWKTENIVCKGGGNFLAKAVGCGLLFQCPASECYS